LVNIISSTDLSTISNNDSFFIDTNVLSFLHYGYNPDPVKVNTYSTFISSLLKKDVKLYVSVFNLQELLHIVEKLEYFKYIIKI